MPDLNWSAVSATADLVSAFAVVVSLIYLAHQIRQNTRAMEQGDRTARATAFSVSATNYRENRKLIYTSAEMTRIYRKGSADPASLTDDEKYRFRMLLSNFVDAHLDMFGQTVQTGYSPETWHLQGRRVIKRVLGTPGGRWFWRDFSEDYPPDFRREIEVVLSEGVAPDVPTTPAGNSAG